MKKHIPNTLTCLNLFSGCIGVLFVLKGEFLLAFYCVLVSGIFDFFDGMVARLLDVKSNIGKELDSLADVISFGFLPGAVLYKLLEASTDHVYLPYLGFVVTAFSALRLAKFNIDERQTSEFIGLNTPMNAFFIMSLPFIGAVHPTWIYQPWILLVIVAIVSFLLVSEIRLFSMKLSSLAWRENKFKYIFLFISIVFLFTLHFLALPLILLAYFILSQLHFTLQKRRDRS
ncbi:CDP-diacylglycerol--serine O-phosphatidyltransferase [Sphingobacterium phlebotomi]|uniref:CDP-diacylglycerol--serine O-phosphatidyltransferase n=1 Tax=Sphingobacterium phlebotomi TaxID=2605433 RepID=A0A5D4H5U0_9SPHI|nr:CDP-diacylglycerol--serine O-phosphatidyltransferase [Sphingobacterium phlebotomi]TYR34180.1 CDP-diacylglycerol--serine O-phosphatidyltransferase [Sphingobacterium phlebotomi]